MYLSKIMSEIIKNIFAINNLEYFNNLERVLTTQVYTPSNFQINYKARGSFHSDACLGSQHYFLKLHQC